MGIKSIRRAAAAALLTALGGAAWAANINCAIDPAYTIIAEGQTVELTAMCDAPLASVNWSLDGVTVTGDVALNQTASAPIRLVTPLTLGAGPRNRANPPNTSYVFTLSGANGADSVAPGAAATVVVKTATSLAAGERGSLDAEVNGVCGTANATALSAMPSGAAQCASGRPALQITSPTAYNWTCASANGGSDASCYAIRGYTVSAVVSGGNGTVSPASQPAAAGAVVTVTASPSRGYSAQMSGCGGSQSSNTFTTGPINADCTVTASFSNTPVASACGSANAQLLADAPGNGLCATGNTASAVTPNAGTYTWTCAGVNSTPASVSCSANRSFTVTATLNGGNGTIAAASQSQQIQYNQTATIQTTPATGYVPAFVSACGGRQSGNSFTTGAVTGACDVAVSFSLNQAPTSDPGRWTGSWQTTNAAGEPVLVVDQSFVQGAGIVDYLPGCVNQGVTNNSASGCAASTSYGGFSFVPGKVLAIRFRTTSSAGALIKVFQLSGADGGNTGISVPRLWLSVTPGGPALASSPYCNVSGSGSVRVATGPGYCTITPDTDYYLNIEARVLASPYPRYSMTEDTDFY